MITKEQLEKIEKFAEQKLKDRDYNHNMDHVYRTVKLAKIIGKKEKADIDVVVAAAYLHDVGQSIRMKNHHITGARMAKQFLKRLKFDKKFIDKVAYCIYHHSSKTVKQAKTKEAKVLYDSDMLQTVGPFGYTRMLTCDTVLEKMHVKDSVNSNKQHQKKMKRYFQTRTGKNLANNLFRFMNEFYKRYEKWDKVKI